MSRQSELALHVSYCSPRDQHSHCSLVQNFSWLKIAKYPNTRNACFFNSFLILLSFCLSVLWVSFKVLHTLALCSQILDIKRQLVALIDMPSRMFRLAVNIIYRVWMKCTRLFTVENVSKTRRMGKPKNTITITLESVHHFHK